MKTAVTVIFVLLSACIFSCKPQGTSLPAEPDFSIHSLATIHTEIFQPSCAISGCHDGHFEPDFRTTQSTFYTTVYHPVKKNNEKKEFEFRVIPGDPEKSVLFERITNCCFVNKDDRMPQENIGVPLPPDKIEKIHNWIKEGAKNIDGTVMKKPTGNTIRK